MRCSCVSCTYSSLALSDDESSDVEPQPTTTRSSRSSRSLADDARSTGSDDEPGPVAVNGGSEVGEEDEEEDEDLEEDVYALYAFLRREKASRGKKRGRGASNAAAATAKRSRKNGTHPGDSAPPASAKPWQPPAGSWEDEIATIDACEDEGSGKLVVYLIWKNGQKTKHETSVIYKKCPQKMLQFYERHVKIIRDDERVAAQGD
ncbi:Chromatin-associated protein swi6 [Metarhizium anisopliae]|nr:Chromatin-associated protein swi6 [Metarhizium anisopliae]